VSIAIDDSRVRATASKRLYVRDRNDWYVEPADAVHALFDAERFSGMTWDPACGRGTIPEIGQARGMHFGGSDIRNRGYLTTHQEIDFLQWDQPSFGGWDVNNIVTNPPFNKAQAFVEKALTIATHKVAALNRLAWIEGQQRSDWLQTTPLARIYAFPWRLNMPPGDHTGPRKGGAVAFMWCVWEIGWTGPPQFRWLKKPTAQPATHPPARDAA